MDSPLIVYTVEGTENLDATISPILSPASKMLPTFNCGNTTIDAASVIENLTKSSPCIPASDKFNAADSCAVISIDTSLEVAFEPKFKLAAPKDCVFITVLFPSIYSNTTSFWRPTGNALPT